MTAWCQAQGKEMEKGPCARCDRSDLTSLTSDAIALTEALDGGNMSDSESSKSITSQYKDTPKRGATRRAASLALQKQGEAMMRNRLHGRADVEVGTLVMVKVDKVDRGSLDAPLLPCVVVEITEHNYARVACKGGVLKSCFSRETLITDTCNGSRLHQFGLENHVQNWRQLPVISIREGAAFDSPLGGQGFFKCSCHGACDSNRCACKKADVLCGSRCHKGANGACKNCEAAMVFKKPKSS
jgi:hypothetical protein